MRPGATRIETFGSLWFIDEIESEYLRMPKREGPRESPPGEDWGGPGAGELEDLKWHPMYGWEVRTLGPFERLVIYTTRRRSTSSPLRSGQQAQGDLMAQAERAWSPRWWDYFLHPFRVADHIEAEIARILREHPELDARSGKGHD